MRHRTLPGCPQVLAMASPHLSSHRRHAINSCVSQPAIAIDSLEKSFPPTRSGWRTFLQPFEKPTAMALSGVSFLVREGEALALLGANGAGKSTLLRILATLLLPTRGAARVAGYDAVREPREVRRRLGYHAGTDHGFYPRLTGRENLQFFGRLNHLSAGAAKQRIARLAEQYRRNGVPALFEKRNRASRRDFSPLCVSHAARSRVACRSRRGYRPRTFARLRHAGRAEAAHRLDHPGGNVS